ncbi:MAG: AI-2E family transporter [Gammaproteobacteria bacterium]|nr:AI-2E family transporter [Gammaproteobacteria bacterium]
MSNAAPGLQPLTSEGLMEVLIRFSVIVALVIACDRIFTPFWGIMVWALILAVSLYPLHQRLARRMGNSQGRAATAIVLAGLLLIGVPTAMLGSSFAGEIYGVQQAFVNNQLVVPAPSASIADWPVIGEKLYSSWSLAADDLPEFVRQLQPQLGNAAEKLLLVASSTLGAIALFIGALIIAGIVMAHGESGSRVMLSLFSRLAGERIGSALCHLSAATIRSVAVGVIGVAFIQALLLGVGFALAGVPAAGLLAIVALVLGIAQLPLLLVFVPVIIYMWTGGEGSTFSNAFFTVYIVLAGFADSVMKPVLLGRGLEVPMPVVLLGALGGMVSAGIAGLFVGAVGLSIGYQVFVQWVAHMDDTRTGNGGDVVPEAQEPASSG